jgi:hypothetical protein
MTEIDITMSAVAGESKTVELTEAICREVIQACTQEFGGQLRAIVLTGSMARAEATFRNGADGWRVLGDAEFLLILHDRSELPRSAQFSALSGRIKSNLSERHGISCSIDLSGAGRAYLRKMRPHIFGYELRKCGKVIWGDTNILQDIPAFEPSEIPLEDGWRLLCNRMIEQLGAEAESIRHAENGLERLQYQTVKSYLDMATSLLLFAGYYAPSYEERANNLILLAGSSARDWPFPMDKFAGLVAETTRWKIGSAQESPSELRILQELAIPYVIKLWRWELARLTGTESGARNGILMRCWMKRQSPIQRLRGWAHILRVEGWLGSWRSWPRWARLAARGSPRYCVYAASAELLQRQGPVRKHLPLRLYDKEEASLSWPEIASEVVFNYRRFLVETRA